MPAWSKSPRLAAGVIAGLLGAASLAAFTHLVDTSTGRPPPRWPAMNVPLRIMLGESTTLADGSSFNTSARSAMQMWNAVIGSAQLSATLHPAAAGGEKNGVNEIVFGADLFGRAFPVGAAAVTTFDGRGNTIIEADVVFNTAFTWDSYRGTMRPPRIDLRRVALHELGHVLGLGHSDENTVSIMNSRSASVESPQPDDIEGVQMLYGPPGKPTNDNFAQAAFITLAAGGGNSFKLTGFNTNATKEIGEPIHAFNSGPGGAANLGGRSVWWRWTVPAAGGSLALDTRGSYFDTLLAVYTGSSISSLTQIASNDDIDPGVIPASTVNLNVTGGTTYWIAVDGFNDDDDNDGADSGHYTLNFAYSTTSLTPPAISSHPASATVTVGSSVSFSVTASGSAPLKYQWLLGGTAIADATGSTYSIASAAASQAGTYSVTVSNGGGSVTSNGATLTVSSVPAPPAPPPSSGGGGGGGGGGGAPGGWFCTALAALGLTRFLLRHKLG